MYGQNRKIFNNIYLKIILPLFFLLPFIFIYIINEINILKNYINIFAFLSIIIVHYFISCFLNKKLIIPFRFIKIKNNLNEINYYYNSGKSWFVSFLIISMLIIFYLLIIKTDNIENVKHLISYGLYGMIYAIYGFLFNVGMESIIVRNDVKQRKIYTRNLKDILTYSIIFLIIMNILSTLFIYYSNGNIAVNDIVKVIYKSDFLGSVVFLIIPKMILLFFAAFIGSFILIKFVAPVLFDHINSFLNILFISLLLFSQIIAAENILIYLNKYSMNDSFVQLIIVLNILMLIVIFVSLLFRSIDSRILHNKAFVEKI